ncbi:MULTISPECIES: hypothetical protein [Moorena]|uniref:hypothetical protein n=1 Tax=Moorena TaxID=1155738 RepID=UPI00131473A8|nr:MULTISPECIES: hypothetical protein [Moorena]NEO81185.1 hypothetical protein [Moorena sp. SIO4G3]
MGTLNPGTVSFRTVIRHNPYLYPKLAIQKFFPIPDSGFPIPDSGFPIPEPN